MNTRTLRAAAAALVIGGAMLGAAPAFAQAVPAAVGNPLIEARKLADAGRYKEALARVDAAAAAAKTPTENNAVSQMRTYVGAKSGDASIGGALGARTKFAADAAAGRWDAVIATGEQMRKSGALDAQSMLFVAQAYARKGDPRGCMNYIRNNLGAGGGGEQGLQLLQRCAYDAKDEAAERSALEQLVARTGKTEYWGQLLKVAERTRGFSYQNTLDVNRLKVLTGNMTTAQDVSQFAEIALVEKMPAEAVAVLQKGIADKVLPVTDRNTRLLKTATDANAAFIANAAKDLAEAQKSPNGDALITIGERQVGQGNAKEAIATIQAGIAKKPTNMAEAQIRLGAAQLAAGQKAEAARTFAAVKGDEKANVVARLYATYARR